MWQRKYGFQNPNPRSEFTVERSSSYNLREMVVASAQGIFRSLLTKFRGSDDRVREAMIRELLLALAEVAKTGLDSSFLCQKPYKHHAYHTRQALLE
jgi:hypothetical protein